MNLSRSWKVRLVTLFVPTLDLILAVEAPPDARETAEVVDIATKLPPSFQTNLKSSKWKERKEALDDLHTLLIATPRIKDAAEFSELTRSLASCIAKDANINCVIVAANCLEEMAKAMIDTFAKYRESVIPLMLERLKERKANVTDAIGAALDAVFATVSCFYYINAKRANLHVRRHWRIPFLISMVPSSPKTLRSKKGP